MYICVILLCSSLPSNINTTSIKLPPISILDMIYIFTLSMDPQQITSACHLLIKCRCVRPCHLDLNWKNGTLARPYSRLGNYAESMPGN